jgi:(2S)-methylsuccinyl-CoA dehydrogenase
MSVAADLNVLVPAHRAADAIERLYGIALEKLRARVARSGALDPAALDREQLGAHALAYVATELASARQLLEWAAADGTDESQAVAAAYVAEVSRSLRSTVWLGATESYAVVELHITPSDVAATVGAAGVARWADEASSGEHYIALAHAHARGAVAPFAPDDETLAMIHSSFRKFVDERVVPIAQRIHRRDELIPMDLVRAMSDMGVFGITIPEAHGGQGLGKVAMCVITEELSRGYIGVGSLGTRAEIAAELIMQGGTDAQKARWLPAIATGSVLPTAVFTEPDYGSDLAHLKTRATRVEGGGWRIDGSKTWITHAARATLMTLLARTDESKPDHNGLSMFLAEKSCGDEHCEFPDPGLSGTEIKVLGYRGMKEYELSFDGFRVGDDALLGGKEGLGKGFRHLMTTFESARIQTAARAVGIAQAALDEATKYATSRTQFGKAIIEFPRVARKLGRMIVLTHAARQLTLYAAQMKDSGRRCDCEAGMAKLLATRAAWECADAAVQIHGGNGYAEEFTASRLLVDARVLPLFEGANEIQAHVVARRLLERGTGGPP